VFKRFLVPVSTKPNTILERKRNARSRKRKREREEGEIEKLLKERQGKMARSYVRERKREREQIRGEKLCTTWKKD